MNPEERFEEILRALADLAEENEGAPVVVEGERDVKALRSLGLGGEIVTVNRGIPLFQVCERLAEAHRRVIILTDWDVRGGQLARRLREGLAANDVKYDIELRARLSRLTQKEVKAVEDLPGYLDLTRPRGADGRRRIRPNRAYYAGSFRR